VEGYRHLRIKKEKKRRRYGWYCLIAYSTINLVIILYLGQNLNPFFQILLVILSFILLIIVYRYLIYKIFFKKKKPRSSTY